MYVREWRKKVYRPAKENFVKREEWRKLRKAVLTRDRNMCQRCEKVSKNGKGLSVHHIMPRDEGGGDDMSNLITLCTKCHDFVELEGFRNRAEIIGSLDPEPVKEIGKPIATGDWHSWVYGGGRNPKLDGS